MSIGSKCNCVYDAEIVNDDVIDINQFKQSLKSYNKDNAYSFLDDCYCDANDNNDKEYLIAIADASNNFARECAEHNQHSKAYDYQTIAFNCLDGAFHVF